MENKSRRPGSWRRRFKLAGIIVILGGMAFCTGLFATAEWRVSRVCARFTPGIDVTAAATIARDHGMNTPRPGVSTTYVMESATYGRYGCKLQFKDGVLESATYEFHD